MAREVQGEEGDEADGVLKGTMDWWGEMRELRQEGEGGVGHRLKLRGSLLEQMIAKTLISAQLE